MGTSKKICLITPNHISTNPRLIKEAIALENAGYIVHIVFTQNLAYLSKEDFNLLAAHPRWSYSVLNWERKGLKSKTIRFTTGIVQRILTRLPTKFCSNKINCLIENRHFFWQTRKAIQADASLYIAHNLGALPVAVSAARHHDVKALFDAEDFHRNEQSDDFADTGVQRKKYIEDAFFPQIAHATAASPLIADEYKKLYPFLQIFPVKNVFPLIESSIASTQNKSLRLFWFSQAVGLNRGIQDVIKALKLLENKDIELHIYGYLPGDSRVYFENLIDSLNFTKPPKIFFCNPVSPDEILRIASSFDIGLALEPGFSTNNRIALSNKIFTYLLGGNAILFSRTPAQEAFYSLHPGIGFIYGPGDTQAIANILNLYSTQPDLLIKHKEASKKLYLEEMNWEKEQQYFLQSVQKALN